jgi:para-nitrobenzyl esterase
VDTAYGPVRGIDDGTAMSWKGVRYAAPPIGDLRFRAPELPQRWTEVADGDEFGRVCPQPPVPNFPLDLGAPQSEDCLFVNVWAPSGTAPGDDKPVMVWLHGGAYVLGSGSQPLYDGRRLAGSGDVIVVSLNYRVGVFGFLDLSALAGGNRFGSNVGLRDVLAALRWVRDNIAAFGGDPSRVTVFGESAGAGIVTTLLAIPEAEGLFSTAIAQSSPATSVYDHHRAQRVAHQVLECLEIPVAQAERITQVGVAALLSATKKVFDEVPVRNPGTLAFVPIVDGDRLMRSPLMPITPRAITSMFNEIAAEQPDLQLPTDEKLGSAYRGKGRGLSIASDVGFRMPSVWFSEGHSRVAPVYLYRFDYASPLMKLLLVGAAHATELPYVWGTLGAPKDVTLKLGGTRTAKAVSKRIRTRWVNFATHAKPIGAPGEPEWTPYQEADAQIRAAWGSDILQFR